MQKIAGSRITLTRGDTFKATVAMIQPDGEEYKPQEGDTVRFAMKKRYSDASVLLEKQIPNDTLLLCLDPEDTKDLNFGSYVYDVELTYANGDVDTFIDRATIELTEEVE